MHAFLFRKAYFFVVLSNVRFSIILFMKAFVQAFTIKYLEVIR